MAGTAGWYPDPGGQPGLYRYWDGTSWSSSLSASPAAPPPGGGGSAGAPPRPDGQQRRSPLPWILIGLAALVALVVLAFVVIIPGVGGGLAQNPFENKATGTPNPCPPQSTKLETPRTHPNDGRVHGGPVSYPRLGSPWSAVQSDSRVPFGRDVAKQEVMVESNYDRSGSSWVASILVAELMAGDGFYSPQEGTAIVAKCVVGVFYGNAVVTREDKSSQATKIDGHDAWVLESHLSFNITGLRTKGELMIIAVVRVDDFSSGLYYASIPDTTPELVEPARQALRDLKVSA